MMLVFYSKEKKKISQLRRRLLHPYDDETEETKKEKNKNNDAGPVQEYNLGPLFCYCWGISLILHR
jgi:hypothetical protein